MNKLNWQIALAQTSAAGSLWSQYLQAIKEHNTIMIAGLRRAWRHELTRFKLGV